MKFTLLLFTLVLFSFGCGSKTSSGEAVVSYKDAQLSKEDLSAMMPEQYSASDSADIAAKIIQLWIERECWKEQAQNTIWTPENEQQLNEYKESLMIQSYQSQLIQEKLDTNIQSEEINNWMKQFSDTTQKYTPKQVKEFILMGRKNKLISDIQQTLLQEAEQSGQIQFGGNKK